MNAELSMKINMILIGILIVVWWVGVWGLIETCVHQIAKGNPLKCYVIYASMVFFVMFVVYLNPKLEENLI